MGESKRGGARPGAGRKKGLRSVPEGQRATIRGVSLPFDLWQTLDETAKKDGVAVSALIRQRLERRGDMETTILNKWGEIIAILDSATAGGLSPMARTNAVEHPIKALAVLIPKAQLTPELEAMLQDRLTQIPDLPEDLPEEQQGAVWIGYYHIRKDLPYPNK